MLVRLPDIFAPEQIPCKDWMKIRPLPGLRDCLEGSVIDTGVTPQAADAG